MVLFIMRIVRSGNMGEGTKLWEQTLEKFIEEENANDSIEL